jgi:hypothetical protein
VTDHDGLSDEETAPVPVEMYGDLEAGTLTFRVPPDPDQMIKLEITVVPDPHIPPGTAYLVPEGNMGHPPTPAPVRVFGHESATFPDIPDFPAMMASEPDVATMMRAIYLMWHTGRVPLVLHHEFAHGDWWPDAAQSEQVITTLRSTMTAQAVENGLQTVVYREPQWARFRDDAGMWQEIQRGEDVPKSTRLRLTVRAFAIPMMITEAR